MKKAFSITEIAVVILIIGILISGITSGADLYNDFRIAQAQSLTNSSRVGRISDLALWLDSVSSKSFDKNPNEGELITKWKDINPTSSDKLEALQTSAGFIPMFTKNSINGLPAVKFDDDCYKINLDITYQNKPSITTFAVFKINDKSSTTYDPLFGNDNGSWDRFFMLLQNNFDNISVSNGSNFFNVAYKMIKNKPYLLTYISQHGIANGSSISYNQNQVASYTENFSSNQNNFINLGSDGSGSRGGCDNLAKFELGEFIIYNRALNAKEISEVQDYLKKKWQIVN